MAQLTSRGTDPARTGVAPDARAALAALAEETASLPDAPAARWALAAAVVELETALGAGLGPAHADPLVVLQRRWARLHRLAGRAAPGTVDPGRVRFLAATLRATTPAACRPNRTRRTRRGLRTAVAGW
ncbi:hypothetical protein GCM10027047_02740 [Rhodococcus aerolatus]